MLPAVAEAIYECHRLGLGNPASSHQLGRQARAMLEDAREGIAELLGANLSSAPPDRVIFTSGGTESNNLAFHGLIGYRAPGNVAISAIEHPSVTAAAERLAAHGWRLVRLPVTADGVLDLDAAAERLTPEVKLVSVMLANHETGAVQPVAAVASLCAARGIMLHTDAAQAAGKLPIDFRASGVTALSLAGHKLHGPLGIGLLLVRGGVPLEPMLVGGSQQLGSRAGTENAALAVGLHIALRQWHLEATQRAAHLRALQEQFERGLRERLPDVIIHATQVQRLPQVSNVAFPGLDRETLLIALDLAGVACSAGPACASGSSEPSPTLRAMGLPGAQIDSSLRFSWGALTPAGEVGEAVDRICRCVNDLRRRIRPELQPPTHRVKR